MVFIRKGCYHCLDLLDLAIWYVIGNLYGTIVIMARFKFLTKVHNSTYVRVLVHIPVNVHFPIPFLSLFLSLSVSVSCSAGCNKKYIEVRHGNNLVHSHSPSEVERKIKGPLTRERMDKICWKSHLLSLYERPMDWYHFQPYPSRWTGPLTEDSIPMCCLETLYLLKAI